MYVDKRHTMSHSVVNSLVSTLTEMNDDNKYHDNSELIDSIE